MHSPYENKPDKSFWKTGVASRTINTLSDVYTPKFKIGKGKKIACLGSCFAQHIGRCMRAKGYSVIDKEPAPPGLSGVSANKFGYELFSARVGNIYVVRQLLQLYEESYEMHHPKGVVWERDGRYFDALRPSVEPGGFDSVEAVSLHRRKHIKHLKRMFDETEVLIFTMGLTESWIHKETGVVYPTAPGTVAGSHSSDYVFINFRFSDIRKDFEKIINYLRKRRPEIQILLTVSPVPLTATGTDKHVLAATTHSKSVLRAVAGELADDYDFIDYFPSYDIITSALARGGLYQPNLRTVTAEGVDLAMQTFFSAQEESPSVLPPAAGMPASYSDGADEQEFCDDLLLEVFKK